MFLVSLAGLIKLLADQRREANGVRLTAAFEEIVRGREVDVPFQFGSDSLTLANETAPVLLLIGRDDCRPCLRMADVLAVRLGRTPPERRPDVWIVGTIRPESIAVRARAPVRVRNVRPTDAARFRAILPAEGMPTLVLTRGGRVLRAQVGFWRGSDLRWIAAGHLYLEPGH